MALLTTGILYCKTMNSLGGWILEYLQISTLMNIAWKGRSVGVCDRPYTHMETMIYSLSVQAVQKEKKYIYNGGFTFREILKVSGRQ